MARDTHSIRCPEEVWQRAKRRAAFEGQPLNAVLRLLLEGYGEGKINPPKIVKQYSGSNAKAG